MARTGTFNGFAFDPEVFSGYMAEQPTWSNSILQSGILVQDQTIMNLIGTDGNVATLPFYQPISIVDNEPLNNDGNTDNVPVEITGSKQTCMLIQRMKAWQERDFTKELTQADPMQHIANSVNDYYGQVRVRELMGITSTVMGITGLEEHITDLSSTSATSSTDITDSNRIGDTTLIFAQQKALGDMADGFGLIIMHSAIYARYQSLGLVDYDKYTVAGAMVNKVNFPTINGLIPVVMDRYTVDTSGAVPVYMTYIIGRDAFLTCEKTNYEDPYYLDYDPQTNAGTRKFFTKQGFVIHPNGISLATDNIAMESPTYAELTTTANWSLAFDHKNVKIGLIKSNG